MKDLKEEVVDNITDVVHRMRRVLCGWLYTGCSKGLTVKFGYF